MLDVAIASLEKNEWVNTTRMQISGVLKSELQPTVKHPPGATYVTFNDIPVKAEFRQRGAETFSMEHYVKDGEDWTLFEIQDTEKGVSYDSNDLILIKPKASPRFQFHQASAILMLGTNMQPGLLVDSLKSYREKAQEGEYRLQIETKDTEWIARFEIPDHPTESMTVHFDTSKAFNVTESVFTSSDPKTGTRNNKLEYVQLSNEWVPARAVCDWVNTTVKSHFEFSFDEVLLGEAANLTDSDFDFMLLPMNQAVRVRDERFADPLEYAVSSAVSKRPDRISDLLNQNIGVNELAHVSVAESSRDVLESGVQPQSSETAQLAEKRSPWLVVALAFGGVFFLVLFWAHFRSKRLATRPD